MVVERLQTTGKIHSSDSQTREWWQSTHNWQDTQFRHSNERVVAVHTQLARYTVQTLKRESGGSLHTIGKIHSSDTSKERMVAECLHTIGKIHSSDKSKERMVAECLHTIGKIHS